MARQMLGSHPMLILDDATRNALIADIASRAFNATQLMDNYTIEREDLLSFRDAHISEIEKARLAFEEEDAEYETESTSDIEVELAKRAIPIGELLAQLTIVELKDLWITRKSQRVMRYQIVVDKLMGEDFDATNLREIRSYLSNAAEELGQIPNRGSATDGDDARATYTITGVHPDELK